MMSEAYIMTLPGPARYFYMNTRVTLLRREHPYQVRHMARA